MATIDQTQGKIYCPPPRFLPYLEKHRIFELFHECIELLVQFRPRDHIQFLKNVLPCAAMKKDKQRIVFLTPLHFDRERFAEMVAECLGIQNITRMTMELLTRQINAKPPVKIEDMNESVADESCICPGEGEYSPFLPMWGEELLYFQEKAQPESVEEQRTDSCVCVCPCVKQGEVEEETREEIEEEEEEEGEWKGEDVPCPPRKRPSKKSTKTLEAKKSGGTGIMTVESERSFIKPDYRLLAECEVASKGWILQDFPMTGLEAENLCALGIIPTHALRIITDEEEANDQDYLSRAREWKKVYRHIPVVEIKKGERTLQTLAADVCKLFSSMPHRHAPMQLRLALIGSRGSGVTTQGQKLAKKYGLVHVEFDIVIARALQQDDEICNLYKIQLDTRPDPEVEAVLLERALLTPPCRKRGWVLTGYPKNIDQMRMLDLIATPPNRIIFIDVPPKECFVRLYYRKTDPCLGDRYKIPEIQPAGLESFEAPNVDAEVAERLYSKKKDNRRQIIHDIEQYFLEKNEMMAYCGKTASSVDGNNTVDTVFQMIEKVIISPAPPHRPRDPITSGYGIEASYERLKKFRLARGIFFNNLLLNPPEKVERF